MNLNILRFCTLFFLGLTLSLSAGCAQKMPGSPQPVFAYEKSAPLVIHVDSILFQDHYEKPLAPPHVEHELPMSPSLAVARWVSKRLDALEGTSGVLTVTINEASVIKSSLPMTKGVKGWFTLDQSEKYTATLVVSFEAVNAPFGNASGQVTAKHSITVPEDASIHEREMAWALMEEGLMEDFDRAAKRLLIEKMPSALMD